MPKQRDNTHSRPCGLSKLQAYLQRMKPSYRERIESGAFDMLMRAQPSMKAASFRKPRINQRTSGFVGPAGDAKFFDTAYASYPCDTTGSVTHLDPIVQGTTVNSREGKAWKNESLRIRGALVTGADTTNADYNVALVWDKQPNKALAGLTDIFDSATSYSFPKRENMPRFVIVRYWYGSLVGESDTTTQSGLTRKPFDEYVRLPPDCIASTTAGDVTGAIGNRISGALLLVTIGNRAPGATACTFGATCRLNFRDI